MGTINVLAIVLAARLIVLVSIAGGIWLSWIALGQGHPDQNTLIALAVYFAGCVLPCVVLALRGR
jgi:hypothetical protein